MVNQSHTAEADAKKEAADEAKADADDKKQAAADAAAAEEDVDAAKEALEEAKASGDAAAVEEAEKAVEEADAKKEAADEAKADADDNANGDVSITEVNAVMLEHNSDASSESGEDMEDAAAVDAPLDADAHSESDGDYYVTLDEWIVKFGDSDESIAAFHKYDTDGDDKISSGELEEFCESEKGKRMYAKANGTDVESSALDKGSNEAGEPSSLKVVIVGDGAIGKVCVALS